MDVAGSGGDSGRGGEATLSFDPVTFAPTRVKVFDGKIAPASFSGAGVVPSVVVTPSFSSLAG